ncbi:YaiI/YqxD family protein [Polymorphobacter sp. PAMC 29334]|uniref:YaiI/YqxD family protein n=1 Tax=Polymorphobacter sp. PAMC 29334 TaxID=2862331 RepID=UPI001C783A14|nr:YaiI/YqxD family protein [Polymorphobacter sp. PAMC 29334]QYE34083.1 YaiI/YqxD family protein [Polymorphobacter sp. PAMC 29334]
MILVDADACPVKDEIYRVARRHGVPVKVVANSYFRVPAEPLFEQVVVGDGFDAADDWIAERAAPGVIVITGDILLADRAVKAGATVLGHNGRPFTATNVGTAVAARALAEDARAMSWAGSRSGETSRSGPAPFAAADRSRFLSALDEAIGRIRRGR